MHYISLLLIALGLTACAGLNDLDTRPPVANVDLSRYLGTWYEIARYEHSFEKGLVGVTATYSLREDGKVRVLNQGFKESLDGKLKQARAVAKIPDPSRPGVLKVYFVPLFGGEYRILELDPDYRYALVGSSSMNYLWILSRTPQMDEATYESIVARARTLGYDTSRLYRVPQR